MGPTLTEITVCGVNHPMNTGCPFRSVPRTDQRTLTECQGLAESPYATSSIKLSALEFLGKNLGMF